MISGPADEYALSRRDATASVTRTTSRRGRVAVANSRAKFSVGGVESAADADGIKDELGDLDGVQLADVDPDTGEAEVRYGEELISEEEIESTVRELGYEVEGDQQS